MRQMSLRRFGALTASVIAAVLSFGALQAEAQGATTVLKFYDATSTFTGVGFDANNPNAVPPLGSSFIITIVLKNIGSQFGKPSGTKIGRVLIECTVLTENTPQDLDGYCNGIAHVPNGFFTFAGDGALTNARISYFGITGGAGTYADDRGQIKVVNLPNGGSDATVMLSS
jgi:hypothetical protein